MLDIISHRSTKQNHDENITPQPLGWLELKRKTATSVGGEDVKKLESSYIADGSGEWYSHFGKVWQLFKMLNIVTT